jgi:hypothetical protein
MKVEQIKKMNVDELMSIVSLIAKLKYGGHFTILSFSNSYKGSFGTIIEREDINRLLQYNDLKLLLMDMICEEL